MPYLKLPPSHQSVELFYELHGNGNTKLLFIMGLLTDGEAWKNQTDFFRQNAEYQAVSYDNRGCARSSTPFTLEYTTQQMAKDALYLINHLEWKQCHVIGVSMGGMISLEFAILAPEKILSLSLVATHAGGISGRAPFVGIRHILTSLSTKNEKIQLENAMLMLYGKRTLSDPDKHKLIYDYHSTRFKSRINPKLTGVVGHILAVQRHYINYADLLKIRYSNFPCLIIVGTEDRLVREANSYMLQRVLGCKLVKLDDAGHGIPAERADELNKELLALFESTAKGSKDLESKGYVSSHEQQIVKEHSSTHLPPAYETELSALQLCCQHRTHCFIYNLFGFIQGVLLGIIFCFIFYKTIFTSSDISMTKFDHAFKFGMLMGCLKGGYRALRCIYNSFRARLYVSKNKLILKQASAGIGIDLPENQDGTRSGIPAGCGFEFPYHSLLFMAFLSWYLLK